ncbi:DUF3761 domain-containing protein [Streptomyces sp. NPDC101227]|uniref:DUF3761 domain-containing protein n=1 Tax=Streptomyces sp. NPDC101227 TaxID=3366136 RepID=UPI00380B876A
MTVTASPRAKAEADRPTSPSGTSGGSSGDSGSTGGGSSSGATARCRDGSLSYSAHHQGTCSHHGGVAVWYR